LRRCRLQSRIPHTSSLRVPADAEARPGLTPDADRRLSAPLTAKSANPLTCAIRCGAATLSLAS